MNVPRYAKLTRPDGEPVYTLKLRPPERIMPENEHTLLMWGGDRQLVRESVIEVFARISE